MQSMTYGNKLYWWAMALGLCAIGAMVGIAVAVY